MLYPVERPGRGTGSRPSSTRLSRAVTSAVLRGRIGSSSNCSMRVGRERMPGSPAVLDTASAPRAGQALPSGVLAFLITDIEGSTQRWEAWPEAMRVAMARHDHLVREALLRAGGHVFRTAGDAFYAAFVSPSDAIAAALAAQQALGGEDFSDVGGIKVRMAIHAGPAESRDNDYFGQGMNCCARLLGIAYGGQILISAAAADMTHGELPPQASLLDLGQHRLKDLAGAEQVYQLVAPGLTARFPTLRSLDAKVHNLPRAVTSFVPREGDVAEVRARLAKYRIVTLVGSGGSGKTRLAIEVGAALLEEYPDGVWIAELAPLEDPLLVAETVCSTIGVPVQGSRSATDSAAGYLRQKKALLILDNCEHLVEAAARLAEQLVLACPSLLLLATSREPLGIDGESTYRVPSLSFPSRTEGITAAEALGYGAVRLFVERATATVDGFSLSDANAPAVANICKHLDGIPMAIELAVPQLRMMPAQGLAACTIASSCSSGEAARPFHATRPCGRCSTRRCCGGFRFLPAAGRRSPPPGLLPAAPSRKATSSTCCPASWTNPSSSRTSREASRATNISRPSANTPSTSCGRAASADAAAVSPNTSFGTTPKRALPGRRPRPRRGLRSTSPNSTTCAPRWIGRSAPRAMRSSASS